MSRTLETKRKILGLLRDKDMTITGLSASLNLSTATVSQHIDELSRAGAIERVENEHFRKLKYYRIRETESQVLAKNAKYLIAAAVVMVVALEFYFYGLTSTVPSPSSIPTMGVKANSNSSIAAGRYGGASNMTPPTPLSDVLNVTKMDGFSFSREMFSSNSSSRCVLVQVSACDNNVPSQFACLNSDYYPAYLSQRQAAFSGQGQICPQYLVLGTLTCESVNGYCEVVLNQAAAIKAPS